jgi:formate hydrogenlyase subunit 3/multisubunit Na+/H+ antiporter MnhD subunit
MNTAVQNIVHFLLMIVFLIIYLLAFIIVKPFLINHKRKISTLLLKISYLIYLLIVLVFVYLFMFFGPADIEYQISNLLFIFLLVGIFLPNFGILLRRKFERHRTEYNYIFSIINLTIAGFIIYKLIQHGWFLIS